MSVSAHTGYLLWAPGIVAPFLATVLLYRRRLLREFPAFSSYLVFHLVEGCVSLFLYRYFGRASWAYYYEYWAAQAIGLALRFGVIYEIFSHVFRPYQGLRHLGVVLFRWSAVVLLIGASLAAIIGPAKDPFFAITGFLSIQRSIDVVQCGLLVFLFLFAGYFGLSWRNYVFGIALGFGIIASVELFAAASSAQFPGISGFMLNVLPQGAYACASILWVAYLLSPEPSRVQLESLPKHELEKWNRELLQLLQR